MFDYGLKLKNIKLFTPKYFKGEVNYFCLIKTWMLLMKKDNVKKLMLSIIWSKLIHLNK